MNDHATISTKTRGGKRPGSGRKPIGDKSLTRVAVFLNDEQIEKAGEIGGGNVSAGVRKALDSSPPPQT